MRQHLLLAALLFVPGVSARTLHVHGPDESPVPGAEARWPGGRISSVGGTLEIPDDVFAAACVTAPGHEPRALAALPDDADAIALRGARALHGTITTPDDKPAPGIILAVKDDAARLGECARRAVSAADGAYAIDGLPDGVTTLTFDGGGVFLPPDPERQVLIRGVARRLDWRVHPAVSSAITVVGADGTPLNGARVRLDVPWTALRLDPKVGAATRTAIDEHEGRTDAAGKLTLPPIPLGPGIRASVTHDGHAPRWLALGGTQDAVARLQRGGTLRFRVVDEASRPLDRASVRLASRDVAEAGLVSIPKPAGADGIVAVTTVPAGRYAVEVRAAGGRPRLLRAVSVAEGAVTDLGDVILEPGAELAGRVGSDGGPVEGAEVTLRTWADGARLILTTETDGDGSFRFDGLDPEALSRIEAEAAGYLKAEMADVLAGTDDLRLTLDRAASLLVRIRDEAGEPVSHPWAALRSEGRWNPATPDEDADVEAGTVLFTGLTPGTYDVRAAGAGRAQATAKDVELRPGERTDVSVTTREGVTLRGRVVDAQTQAPLARARIASGSGSQAESQADGTFQLAGLESAFTITAEHPQYERSAPQQLSAQELPEDLVIELQRGCSLRGSVFGGDGKPLAGASVADQQSDRAVTTDASGAYVLEGLPPGERTLAKTNRPGTLDGYETAVVTLTREAPALHDFGAKGRLTGRVTRSGEPARGARLTLMRVLSEAELSAMTGAFNVPITAGVTDEDGRYVITGLDPGTHAAMVAWQGNEFGRDVVMPPGVAEHVVDLEFPDVVISGRVVDAATDEPIAGASVSVAPKSGDDGRGQLVMVMRGTDMEDGLHARTDLTSTTASGADGAFTVRIGSTGALVASAHAPGFKHARQELEAAGSRSDVLLKLTPENAGKAVVRMRDAVTGEPLTGTIVLSSKEGSSVNGGSSEMQGGMPDEGTSRAAGWSAGRGIAVTGELPADDDGNLDVTLSLGPGGGLKLLVPEGSLRASAMLGLDGELSLTAADATLTPKDAIGAALLRSIAREIAPGEFLLSDLPPGPVSVTLGSAAPRSAEIVAGEIVELDLR